MGHVARLVGHLDEEAVRWANGLSDPASGQLVLVVPPATESLGFLAGEILGLLGKPAAENPQTSGGAETTELAFVWLRAHRIDRIVLLHADWLKDGLANELCAFAALASVDLVCAIEESGTADAFQAWAGKQISWLDFVADEERQAAQREILAAEPGRHQLDLLPTSGWLKELRRVEGKAGSREAALVYYEMAWRLERHGVTEREVVSSVVGLLRDRLGGAPADAELAAVAAALAQAGWALWSDRGSGPAEPPASAAWKVLRDAWYPFLPAIVTLIAARLTPVSIGRLLVRDVAEDGSFVSVDGDVREIPPGGRVYLVAQRLLAGEPDVPFVAHHGRRPSPRFIATAASATFAGAGLRVETKKLEGPRSADLRWLAEHGFGLRKAAVTGEPIRKDRLCAHGLPGCLEIDGVLVGHSQHLCLGPNPEGRPERVRPKSYGYSLVEIERTPLGRRIAVSRHGEPAGELVGLTTASGPIWVEVCGPHQLPAIESIRAAFRAEYPEAEALR